MKDQLTPRCRCVDVFGEQAVRWALVPSAVDSRSSSLAGSRNKGIETLPFGVGEIGRVAPFHAQERTSSTCPTQNTRSSPV